MADPPMRQWPAADGDKGHTAIDKARVKKLLAALVQDLKRYEGAKGAPEDVGNAISQITATSVGAAGVGGGGKGSSYPGGELMWRSIQSVNGSAAAGQVSMGTGGQGAGFTGAYQQFLSDYAAVVDALFKAAGVQEDADTQSILQQAGGNSSVPTTPTSSGGQDGGQGSFDT